MLAEGIEFDTILPDETDPTIVFILSAQSEGKPPILKGTTEPKRQGIGDADMAMINKYELEHWS
jgi:hypothetical protein